MKQIIVLGGGYGGVLTAKKLAIRLKNERDVRITLIDRKPYHTLLTELHEVAAKRVDEDSIKVDLKKIFAGMKNVEVVLDEITEFDFPQRLLRSEARTYRYDYLVIGTGSKPAFFGTPGAEEHAFTLWSYEDAVLLRERFTEMFRRAVKERDPIARAEMLSFVVVGAGFTGVEMIGELAEHVEELCKAFYVDRADVQLHVVDMAPKILPILPDRLIQKAQRHLEKLGVNISTGLKITGVKPNAVCLGDKEIASRTVIWTAGVEGSELAGKADVAQQGRKRLLTNDKLQSVDRPEVYVVGDNIFYIPEGEKNPVPQMVENAEQAAPIIAHNIEADIRNRPKKPYKPSFHGTMVSIGSRYGVANVGVPGRMFQMTGFFAMFVKHFINLFYLFQVAGFNKCYSYLLHEIFHIEHRRSFLGGHFSKRSPNFWLVPLRVFVGVMWLIEGWEKLLKIIEDPNKIFLIPAPWTDGTSGASVAADGAGEAAAAVQALPVPGFIDSIVKGSMDMMFYTSDGGFTALASIFQTGMVLAELAFGLMLIVGLFTAPAAVATVAMGVMIWSSGMAAPEMLWYMFAGVALIGGSGSTFGLDYYAYPMLKKVWKRIPFIRRWYLYAD
ncbi:NAD(P)/FAD-dependent oxidoreductase [Paenibacillus antri]|uniref:NADH:ubiquinone reductase (non-electrogenic) n=1 Tax=Paenibacillus antri TaxID=2582848 RepID=A0A5R9GCZ2_9BACL|nr:NAD(P)/FAD-dependent oxidoreductase [Paenibacillus antri]TLS51950.1 NAD(P)/FAD-dependent oxidoreductase [Paenibacillus antri]